ncbi:MAG TPA: ADYC domain-containing protein [Kofleriaceae bacterium]|nr:ADYC domain-containing protein [Kofleriaceae bacterium]
MTLIAALAACDAVELDATSPVEQAFINNQGTTMQGLNLQGASLAGMTMQGFRVDGATLSGEPLSQVRVERGELVAERGPSTLRGTALVGAHLRAQVRNLDASPPATAQVEYRITAIAPETSSNDPTHTGHTFLYTLEQLVAETGSWQPACDADADGRRVALPLAATFDEHGDRIVSSSLFTFGCTTGAIAKCYRWGYRPWVTGFGDLAAMHWTCTRLARADYCGIGRPHTRQGTTIDVWDNLPAPGPIQRHEGLLGLPPVGMLFEAGWNTGGAVCLSRTRWLLGDGLIIAELCPDRLVSPGLLGQTVCDTVSDVLGLDSNAKMFNEAFLNLVGP